MDARDTEKAPDAFRTISEVADDLALPQHVLRFWETRFPQIKPIKRAGGRRFYRPEDVDLLRGIRHLLYTDGFTIKGAQRILKDQGVRYVQDLGIEREVAVMRSAKPARGEAGDGVTFGGLLGLLPRRRAKAQGGRAGEDDDLLPELPEAAELPLPFPDAEADRDLADEPPEPPIAFRPAGRHREREPQLRDERRATAFEAPGQRREPTLGEDLPLPPSDGPHGAREGAPPRTRERVEPVLAPQRPSRGPAARVSQRDAEGMAAPSHPPAFDDPLLPFLDDTPVTVSAVSEPIEARIQRLRAQERRPMRPHETLEEVEGPGEDIQPHGRRAPSPLDLPHEEAATIRPAPRRSSAPAEARRPAWEDEERLDNERLDDEPFDDPFSPHPRRSPQSKSYEHDGNPPAPAPQRRAAAAARSEPRFHEPGFQEPAQEPRREARQDPRQSRIVQDGEWRQTDWVEATWHGAAENPAGLPGTDARSEEDEPLYRPIERPSRAQQRHSAMAADPETEMMNEERRRTPLSPPRGEWREPSMSAAPPMSAPPIGPSAGRAPMAHAPAAGASAVPAHARPPAGWADEEVRRVWDEGWGEGAPQSLPRASRVGPLIGPIQDEDDPNSGVLPEAEQRRIAERMSGRAVAPDPYVAQRRGPPPWSRAEAPVDLPNPSFRDGSARGEAPVYAPEPEPPAQRVPREPLRSGPPEQYLPPHLRSEPRMAGQPPMAAPVLSRDDVHRMQSALYELGECRRLMEEVLAPRDTERPGE
uniref:MerR family transcriptional regulator n=1 Tax=Xanthobacter autotrophicus (strain ATCC BAA-1158 / Py2) TaxID=78245 RepID=UPI0037367E2F